MMRGGMAAVREYYQKLGAEYADALNDMLVLDAVICNTDRHFGNFGLLIDNHTNQITAPAPLFDHGNSLFNFAAGGDLQVLFVLLRQSPPRIDFFSLLCYNPLITPEVILKCQSKIILIFTLIVLPI